MTKGRQFLRKLAGQLLAIAVLYFYLWFAMDIPQFRHDRLRAFQWGLDFPGGFLTYSGGPVAYVHSLLTQLYIFPWTGIAVLTALFAALYAGVRGLLACCTDRSLRLAPLFPAILGFVLVNSRMTLVPIMAVTASVYAAWLYVRLPLKKTSGRLLVVLAGAALLYYTFAGGFLLFIFLCSLHDFLARRRSLACISLVLGLLLPVAMRHWIYEPDLLALYFRNAPLEEKTRDIDGMTVLLYAVMWISVPAGILAAAAGRSDWGRRLQKNCRVPLFRHRCVRAVLMIVACGALAVPPVLRARFCDWTVMERLMAEEQWEKALSCVRHLPEQNILISHMANRALFHSGLLLDEMFRYPQYTDDGILLFDARSTDDMPRVFDKRSSIYLELGMMSRAERWTLDAITIMGELPFLAKRMITINMVKGRPAVAAAYLGTLKKMPFQRAWAMAYERRLREDPALEHDEQIQSLRRSMPQVDYVDTLMSEELLSLCLTQNPGNRMAFEYLMAHYMLARRSEKLAEMTPLLDRLGYRRIPRHWEEALLSHCRKNLLRPTTAGALSVSPETSARFERFLAATQVHHPDTETAREMLRRDFGDTYWFF